MPDTISTSIRMTPCLRQRIKKAAHRRELTQTQFITLALEMAVVVAGVKAINEQEKGNE